MHRVKGELILMGSTDDTAEAESEFAKAKEGAFAQQAKIFELRAATRLAQLLTDQSKQEEAWRFLDQVYGRFAEGLDTKDLRVAKALFETLN